MKDREKSIPGRGRNIHKSLWTGENLKRPENKQKMAKKEKKKPINK